MAASHTLSECGTWVMPGPELVTTKLAWSPEAKLPCGGFPHNKGSSPTTFRVTK
jgi:hypothetical protein